MWTALAARLRGQARAEVLTVAAFNYYIARDAVRAASPSTTSPTPPPPHELPLPNLADLLSAALRAGLEPEKLRQIIPSRDRTPLPGTDL